MNVEEGPETNEPSKSSATEEDDATANEGPGRSTGNPQGMMETGLAVDCDISPGTVAHAALSIACSMMNETRRTNTGSSDSVPNPIPVNRHSRHVTPSPNFPGPEAVVAASIVAATNAVPYAPAMLTAPPPECTSSRDSESMVLRDVSATKAAELYNLMKVDNSPSLPCDTTIFVNNDVEGNSTVSSLMATRVSVPSYVVETGVATVGPLAHSVPAAMTLDDTKPLVNNDCIELPSEEEMISSLSLREGFDSATQDSSYPSESQLEQSIGVVYYETHREVNTEDYNEEYCETRDDVDESIYEQGEGHGEARETARMFLENVIDTVHNEVERNQIDDVETAIRALVDAAVDAAVARASLSEEFSTEYAYDDVLSCVSAVASNKAHNQATYYVQNGTKDPLNVRQTLSKCSEQRISDVLLEESSGRFKTSDTNSVSNDNGEGTSTDEEESLAGIPLRASPRSFNLTVPCLHVPKIPLADIIYEEEEEEILLQVVEPYPEDRERSPSPVRVDLPVFLARENAQESYVRDSSHPVSTSASQDYKNLPGTQPLLPHSADEATQEETMIGTHNTTTQHRENTNIYNKDTFEGHSKEDVYRDFKDMKDMVHEIDPNPLKISQMSTNNEANVEKEIISTITLGVLHTCADASYASKTCVDLNITVNGLDQNQEIIRERRHSQIEIRSNFTREYDDSIRTDMESNCATFVPDELTDIQLPLREVNEKRSRTLISLKKEEFWGQNVGNTEFKSTSMHAPKLLTNEYDQHDESLGTCEDEDATQNKEKSKLLRNVTDILVESTSVSQCISSTVKQHISSYEDTDNHIMLKTLSDLTNSQAGEDEDTFKKETSNEFPRERDSNILYVEELLDNDAIKLNDGNKILCNRDIAKENKEDTSTRAVEFASQNVPNEIEKYPTCIESEHRQTYENKSSVNELMSFQNPNVNDTNPRGVQSFQVADHIYSSTQSEDTTCIQRNECDKEYNEFHCSEIDKLDFKYTTEPNIMTQLNPNNTFITIKSYSLCQPEGKTNFPIAIQNIEEIHASPGEESEFKETETHYYKEFISGQSSRLNNISNDAVRRDSNTVNVVFNRRDTSFHDTEHFDVLNPLSTLGIISSRFNTNDQYFLVKPESVKISVRPEELSHTQKEDLLKHIDTELGKVPPNHSLSPDISTFTASEGYAEEIAYDIKMSRSPQRQNTLSVEFGKKQREKIHFSTPEKKDMKTVTLRTTLTSPCFESQFKYAKTHSHTHMTYLKRTRSLNEVYPHTKEDPQLIDTLSLDAATKDLDIFVTPSRRFPSRSRTSHNEFGHSKCLLTATSGALASEEQTKTQLPFEAQGEGFLNTLHVSKHKELVKTKVQQEDREGRLNVSQSGDQFMTYTSSTVAIPPAEKDINETEIREKGGKGTTFEVSFMIPSGGSGEHVQEIPASSSVSSSNQKGNNDNLISIKSIRDVQHSTPSTTKTIFDQKTMSLHQRENLSPENNLNFPQFVYYNSTTRFSEVTEGIEIESQKNTGRHNYKETSKLQPLIDRIDSILQLVEKKNPISLATLKSLVLFTVRYYVRQRLKDSLRKWLIEFLREEIGNVDTNDDQSSQVSPNVITELLRRIRRPVVPVNDTFDQEECIELSKNECNSSVSSDNEMSEPAADDTDEECTSSQTTETILSKIVDQIIVQSNDFTYDRDRLKTIVYDFSKEFCYVYRKSSSKELYRITSEEPNFLNFLRETGHTNLADSLQRKNIEKLEKGLRKFLNKYLHEIQSESDDEKLLRERVHDVVSQIVDDHLAEQSNACDNEVSDKIIEFSCNKQYLQQFIRKTVNDEIKTGMTNREIHIKRLRVLLSLKKKHGLVSWLQTLNKSMSRKSISAKCVSVAIYEEGKHTSIQKLVDENEINGAGQHLIMTEKLGAELPSDLSSTYDNTIVAYKNLSDLNKTAEARFDSESLIFLKEYIDTHITDVANENRLKLYSRENKIHDSRKSLNLETDEECITQTCCSEDALNKVNDNDSNTVKNSTDCSIVGEYALPLSYDVATTSNTRNDNQQSQYSSASVSVVQPRRVTFSNQNCLFYGPPLTSGENNEVISRDDVEPVRENSEKLREEEADIMEKLYRVLAHDAKTLKDIGEAREESKIARNVWISDVMNERKYTTRRDDFQDIDVTEATEDSVEGNDEKVTHFNTSEEEVEGIGCTSRQFLHEEVDTGVFQQYHTEDEARQSHLLEFVRPGVHPGGEEVNEEATEMRDWLEEYIEATVVARMQNHRRTGDSILSECDHRNTYRRERGVVNSLTSDVQSYQDCCRRGGRNHGERNDAHSTTCVRGSDVALWSLDDVEESGSLEPHTTEVQNDLGTNDNMSDVAEKVVSESETSSRGAGEDPTGEDPTGEDPTGEELLLQRFLQDAASRVGEPEWRNELLRCLRQYVADAVERCVQRRSNTLAGSRTKQRLSRSLSQVCRLESTGQRFASDNNTAIKEQVKLELREWLCYYVEERLDERLGPILGTPSDITEGEAGSNIERYGSLPTVRLGHFDPNVRDSPGGSGTFPENISSQRSICTDETFTSPISQDIHINKSDVSVAILCGETNSIESYDSYEYCFDRHTDVKKKESKNILKTSLIDMALVEVQPHQLDRSQDILEDYHRCTTPLSMISRTLNSYRDMVKQNVEEQVDNISITKNISDEKIVENLNNQPIVSDELNETIERKNNEVNQVLPVMAMNDVQDVDNDNIIPYDFIAPMTPLGSPRSASIIGSVHRLVKQTSESSPLIPNLYESNAEYNSDSSKKGRYLIFQPFQIKEKLRDRKSSEELGIILHAPSNVSSETSTLSSVPSTGVGATISITSCPSAAQRVNTESKELLREITSQDVPSPYIFHKVSFNKCPIDSGSKESENNNGGTSHKNTRFNYNNQVSSHQNTSTIDTNIRKSLLSSTTHRSLQNNDLTIGNINRYSQNYYSTLGNTHSFGLKMNRRSSASSHIPKRVQYNRSEPTVESDTFPTLSLQYVHDKTYTYIPQGVSTEMKNSDDGSKPFFCVPQPFKKLYKSDTTAISSDRNVSKIDSTLSKTSNQVEEKLQQNTGYTPENILRNRKDSHLGIRLFIPKESPKSSSSPQVYVPQNISSDQIPSSVGNISENLFQNVGRYSNICSPKHIPTHKSLSLVEGTSLATNQKFYQSVDPRYAHKSYDSSSHKTITQVSGSPYIERDKTNGTLRSDNLYNIRTIPTATESSSQTQVSNSTKSINNIEQKESQVHSPKRYNSSKSNIPNSVHSEKPASEVGKGPYVHNEKPKETPKGADPFSPKSIPTYKAASEVGKGPYPSEKKTEKTSKTLEPFSPKSIPTYKAASEVGKGPYPAEKKMEKTSKTTEPFSPECIPTFKVASEVGKGPYPAEMKTEKAPKTPEPFSPKSIPTDKIASEVGKGPYPSDKKKEKTSKTPEPFSPKSIPTDKAASEVGKGPYPAEKKMEKTSKTTEPFSPECIPTFKVASEVGKGPYPAEMKTEKAPKTPEPFSPKSIPTDKIASEVGKGPYPSDKKKENTSKTPEPFSPKSIPTDKAASEVGKGPYPAEKKKEKTSKTPEPFSPKSIPTEKAASGVGKGPYPAEKKKEKTSKTPEPFSPKSIPTDKAASGVGKGPYPAEKKTEKTSKTPETFSPKSIPTDKAASEVGKGPYPAEKKKEKTSKTPEPFSPKSIPTDKAASEVGKGPYPAEKKTEKTSKTPETFSPKSIPTDKAASEVGKGPYPAEKKKEKTSKTPEPFSPKSIPTDKTASEVGKGPYPAEKKTEKTSKTPEPFSPKSIPTDKAASEVGKGPYPTEKKTEKKPKTPEPFSPKSIPTDKAASEVGRGPYPTEKKTEKKPKTPEPFSPKSIPTDKAASEVGKGPYPTEKKTEKKPKTPEPFSPKSIPTDKAASEVGKGPYPTEKKTEKKPKSPEPFSPKSIPTDKAASEVGKGPYPTEKKTEASKIPETLSPKSIPTDKTAFEVHNDPFLSVRKISKDRFPLESFLSKSMPMEKVASEVDTGHSHSEMVTKKLSKPFGSSKNIFTDEPVSEFNTVSFSSNKNTDRVAEDMSANVVAIDKTDFDFDEGFYPSQKKFNELSESFEPFNPRAITLDEFSSAVQKNLNNFITENTSISICSNKFDSSMGRKSYFAGRDLKHSYKSQHPIVNQCVSNLRNSSGVRNTTSLLGRNTESNASVNEPHQSSESNFPEGNDNATSKLSQYHAPNTISTNKYLVLSPKRQYQDGHINTSYCTPEQSDQEYNDELSLADNVSCSLSEDCSILLQSRRTVSSRMLGPYTSLENSIDKSEGTISFISTATSVQQDYSVSGEYQKTAEQKIDIKAQSECQSALNVNILSECGVSKLNDAISSITLQSSVPAPTISDIKSSISYQLERNAIIPFESNNTTKLPSYRNSHSDKSCYLTDELDKRQFCLPTLCDLIGDLHLSQDTESNSSNISSLTEYPAFNIHPWVVNSIVEGEKPISNEIAPGPFPNSDIYSTAFESSINSNTHALDHTLDVPDTSITIDKLSTPESDSESRIKTNATDIISLELRDNKRAQEVDGEVEDEDSSLSRESSKGNNKYIENSKSVVRSTGLNTDKCNDFVFDRNFTKHDTHKTNYFKISGFSTHQITSDIKIDTPISRTDINVQNDSLNNKIVLQQKQDVTHSFQQFSDFKRNLISSQPSTGAFTRSEGVKNSSLSDNQCADSLIGMSSSHINTSLVNKEVYFNGTDNSDSAKNFSNTIVERETIPNDINIPLNSEKRVNEIQSSSVVSSSVFANKDGYSSAKMNELHSEGEIYKCENDLEKFTPLRVRTEENDTLRGTLYNQQKIVENFISSERMDFTVDNDSYAGACATLGTNLVISIDKMRSEENFNGCSNKNTEIMTSNTPSYEDEKHKRLDTEPQEVINQADVITSIEVTLKPNATITNQELSSSQTFGSVNAQDNKCDTTCVATNSQEKHSQKVPYIDTYPSSTVELAPIQPSVAPCATGKESHDELHEIYSPKYQSREKNTLLPSNREIHDIPCSALRGTENYLKGNILSSQDKSRPEIEQNCKSDVFNKLSESESHLPDSNTNDECRNNSLQRIHSINMSENLGVMPRAPSLIGLMTPESSPLFNIEQSNDFGDSSTVSNISLTVERILSPAGNIPSSLSSILSLITRMPLPVSNVISNESNIPAIADAVATRRPCPTNPMQPVSVQNILQGSRLSGMPFHLQSQSLGLEESETRSSETSELAGFGNEHIQDPEESSSNDPITIDIHVSWIAAHPTFDTESNDESQGLSSDVCTLQRFSNFRTQGYDDNTHLYNLFDDKQVQVLDFNVDMDSNALMTSSILQWQESSSDSDTQVSRDQTDETLRAADGCLLVLPSTHSSDDMEDETVSTNLPISVTNASVDDLLPTRLRDNIVDVDEYASAFLPGMQGYWFDEHGRVAAQVHGSARPVPLHDIIDDTRKTVSDSSTPTSCSFTEAQCVAEYSCPADLLDIPAEHTITGDPFLDTNNFSNPTQQNPNTTSPPPLTTIVALAVSTQLDSPDTPSGSVPGNNNSQDNAPSTSVNTVDDEEHHLAQALRQEQHEATCTRLRAPVTAAASRAARVRPEIVPSQSASRTQKSDIPRKAWETEEFDVESKDESDSDEEDKESSDVVSVIHDPIYKHDKPQLPSAKAEPNKVSDENKVCNDVLEAEPIEEILNLTQNENTESGASRDNSSKTNNSEMNSESSKFYSIETPENVMDCDVQKLVSDVNNIDKETHSDENVLSQDKNVQILNNDVPIVGVSDNSQIHVTETQVRSVNDEQRLDKKFSVLENTIGVVAKEHSHSRNENVETEVIQSNSPTSSQYLGSQISPRESQSVYEREDSSTNNNKEVKKEIEKIIDVPQNLSEAPKLLRVTEDEIVSRIHVISEHEATFSCDTNPVIIADRTDIIAQSTNSTIAGTYNDPLGADVKKHDEDDALCVLEKEYNKLNVNISSHKLKLSSLEDSDVSSYVNTAIENDSVDENEHYPFAVIVNSILENITCNKPTSDKETIKLNEVELSSHHEIDNAVAYTSTSDGPPYETYSSNKDEIKAVGEIVSSIVASMKSSSVSSNKDMTHGLSNETDLYTVPDPTEFLLAQNKKSSGEDDTLYEGESNEMENIINDVGRIKGNEMEPKQGGRVNDNKTDRPATPTDVLTVPGPSGYCETTKNQMDDSPKGITPSLESTSEEEEEGRKEQKKEVQECVVADMQLQTDTKSSSDKHGMKEEKSEKIKSESVVEDIEHKEVSFSEETNFLSAITVSTAARVFHSLPYDDHKIPTVETSAPQIVTAATALSLHTNFSLSTEEMLASTKSCTDDVASHSTKHESSYLVQLDQRRSRCSEREDLIDAISIVSPESDSHEEDDKSKKKKKLGTRVRNFFVKTFRLKKKKQ